MRNTVFYRAGRPVCASAERQLAAALDPARYRAEVARPGERKNRIAAAEAARIRSVPALVIGGTAFHSNCGAALADLR